MDKQQFVQNIKFYCLKRNVKPTVACREAGVGSSFINNIEARGQIPSVEKVQQLAGYLGVSTSELLGEQVTSSGAGGSDRGLKKEEQLLLIGYRNADPRTREIIDQIVEPFCKIKKTTGRTG